MYPVGANGASQAILDARVLARELALQPSLQAAVTAYDAERRPATAAVVLANRQVGPERCMDLVEERAPDGFANLGDVISQDELEKISESTSARRFDPETLNAGRRYRSALPSGSNEPNPLERLIKGNQDPSLPRESDW